MGKTKIGKKSVKFTQFINQMEVFITNSSQANEVRHEFVKGSEKALSEYGKRLGCLM